METILVTGDRGFIGRHLVPVLKKSYNVIGLSKKHDNVDYRTVDFDISHGVPDISGIDYVIHLAADIKCESEENAIATNVVGTRNLLELAKKNNTKNFIFASTSGVYGYSDKVFKETDEANPMGTYQRTKYQAEQVCKEYSKFFPVNVLRISFPYGTSIDNKRLMNRLMHNVETGHVIKLNKDNKPVINPVYIEDLVEFFLLSLKHKNGFEIVNIGGKDNTSILDIIQIIERKSGHKAKIEYNSNEVNDLLVDITKSKKIFGYEPKIEMETGIERVILGS